MEYYFELPSEPDLKQDQRRVLMDTSNVAIKGGPGTGKTLISVLRHIRNYETKDISSFLLTYTKTLELYLARMCAVRNHESSLKVARTLRWRNRNDELYDEIIIDEAQDIDSQSADRINANAEMISFGADDSQGLYENGLRFNELNRIYNPSSVYTLARNHRTSKAISRFIQSVFPNRNFSPGDEPGPPPQLLFTGGSIDGLINKIKEVIRTFSSDTHNIGILVPLVNSAYHRTRTVSYYFNELSDDFDCSMHRYENETFEFLKNIHVCSFKSSKGLEFDTVIFPEINYFKEDLNRLSKVNDEDYYVAFSRAKTNLILIDNDERNSDGLCHLEFFQNQINSNIIEVETKEVPPTISEIEDDLPF